MGVITETLRVDGTERAAADLQRVGVAADGASTAIHGPNGVTKGFASLVQQMPDVVSQLSSGTGAMQVFTQQGLQVVQSNQALLASLTSLAPALAAIGLAVGEVYVAYAVWNQDAREAAEVQAVVAAATEKSVDWTKKLEIATRAQAVASGELTQAESDRAEVYDDLEESTAALRTKQAEIIGEMTSLKTTVIDTVESMWDFFDVFGLMSGAFDLATTGTDDLTAQFKALGDEFRNQKELADQLVETSGEMTTATKHETRAVKERSTAKQDAAKAEKDAAAEEKRINDERQAQLDNYIATVEYMEGLKAGVTIDPRARPGATTGTLLGSTATLGGGGLGSAGMLSSMSGAMSGIGAGSGALAGALKGLLGGGVSGLLNVVLPPPWGQIASALVSLLAGGGAGAVREMLSGVVDSVLNVVTGIPAMLMTLLDSDFLPAMVIQIIEALPALVEGILAGAGELLVDLVAMLPDLAAAFQQVLPDLVAAIIKGLGILVIDLIQAIAHIPQAIAEAIMGFGTTEWGRGFRGIGDTWGEEWRKTNVFSGSRGGGGNITVNGMVGDRVGLAAGIRGLFDGDFGRSGGRF